MSPAHYVALACLVAEAAIGTPCAPFEEPTDPEVTMHGTSIQMDAVRRMQTERTGDGPPLVLVGGGLTGWASWRPHAERLADRREVVRLQLLAVQHGLEDRPLPDGYSVATESRALVATLDQLGLDEPVDLVAWSYGAVIALDFALDHPERVRTLTLIEPPALWVLPDHGRGMPDVRELDALLPDGMDDVGPGTLERFVRGTGLVPPDTEPQSLPQWGSWVEHRRSLRGGRAVFTHSDDVARLRAFLPPVMLVTGQGTSPFLRAVHDGLAAALPNAHTLELSGGHAPHLVEMDVFLQRLAGFQASEAPGGDARRQTTTSRDGTRIAFWRSGSGPPLLLVHGATADHTTTWQFVRTGLARRFTVYAMDRRGRGGSGDAADYDFRREAEDVAAVVDAIGGPVSVLGHSYGALAAIEAALLTPDIDRLILYEGVPYPRTTYEPGVIDRVQERLDAGDVEGVLTSLYRDVVGMPPDEIDMLRSQSDAWAARLRNAWALPRELRADAEYVFEPERFREMRTPTLLLVGEDSPSRELRNANGVAAALLEARVLTLPGQQHAAMYTAPDLFANAVTGFLDAER